MSEPGSNHWRRAPLRFVWQMDAEHRFTVGSEELAALMGQATAAMLGRPWPELAAALALDPEGQIARALASHDTWSGLSVSWPVDNGSERLMVELSGLPVFDRERAFRGYRGFGVCRDVARLAVLVEFRQGARIADAPVTPNESDAAVTDDAATAVPARENVVALRPASQPIAPALSPGERSAFHELTRKLHERLTAASSAGPPGATDGLHSSLAQAVQAAQAAQDLPEPDAIKISATDPDPALARAALASAQAEIVELTAMLATAKRQAEKVSAAKSDFLAKISNVVRAPLNAMVGLSEIMAQEKLGPIGDERYRQYSGDIRSAGEHLLALIDDLIDLFKIEAGKLELDFAGVALNSLTQQCVATLQPRANRERIIVRTALSPRLPPVIADARSLRQIVLNLIDYSTRRAGAGGQVIVSTTLTDLGEVVLRVRDSGGGLSDTEIAHHALEPAPQIPTAARPGQGGSWPGLPLTKALAEANHAALRIASAPHAGTLIEVAFPAERVAAQDSR
jgi:signal transduction histidine kinase